MELTSRRKITTKFGDFDFYVFKNEVGVEHIALVKGEIENQEKVFCRVHSFCVTGEVFNSLACSCRQELDQAMKSCEEEGKGIIVWLNHNTFTEAIENFELMNERKIERDFKDAADILKILKVGSIVLQTKNQEKISQLKNYVVSVVNYNGKTSYF
jgi:3,4-dihydroxy 2-butanone 4-phosphate synthase/GTP cyclohydrolase II